MKWPLVWRRNADADAAAWKAEANRQRERAEHAEDRASTEIAARRTITRQHADLDAANRRLEGRALELGRRLSACAEADPEYAAALEKRVERLAKGAARYLAAFWAARAENEKLTRQAEQTSGTILSLTKSLVEARQAAAPRPIDGGTASPVSASAELLQARAHARALDVRLAEVTAVNQRCTCGGGA